MFQLLFLIPLVLESTCMTNQDQHHKQKITQSYKQSFWLSFVFALYCYLYNKGYYLGRVLSSDVISYSQSVWVEIVSVMPYIVLSRQKLSCFKLLHFQIFFVGFLLIIFCDKKIDQTDSEAYGGFLVVGNMLTLFANVLLAIYSIRIDEIA